ncbi:MAG TPA: O-antigen ligase family protein [bacterium]|jgi:O-antigen ligase|nr:O-antigen ligase family protein [bacterium]
MSFALAAAAWFVLAWQGGLHPWQQALAAALLALLVWRGRSRIPAWRDLGGVERVLVLLMGLAGLATIHSLRPQTSLNAWAALGLGLAAAFLLRRRREALAPTVAKLWMFGGGAFTAAFLAWGLAAWMLGPPAPDPVDVARWFFPNQNLLAGGVIVPAMLVALASLAWALPLRERLIARLSIALGGLALVWAGSRGAYLALAAGSFWLVARGPKRGWGFKGRVVALLLWVAAMACWAPFSRLALRIQNQDRPGLQDMNYYRRTDFWKGAAELSLRSPLLGQGPGAFSAAAYGLDLPTSLTPTEPVARYRLSLDHAHNEWLEAAVEAGWPIALMLLLCAGAWKLRRWRSERPDKDRLGLEAVLIAAGALSLVDMNLRTPALAWGLMLSFCAVEPLPRDDDATAQGLSWSGKLAVIVAALAVFCLAGSALAERFRKDQASGHADGRQALTAICFQPLDAGLAVSARDQGVEAWPWSAWAGRRDPVWWWGEALRSTLPAEQAADARQAVALRPYFAPGWYWLGLKLAQNKDAAGASQAMGQALSLEPNFCRVLAWEADQDEARGETAEARDLARKVFAVHSMRVSSPDPYTSYIQSVDPDWLKRQAPKIFTR